MLLQGIFEYLLACGKHQRSHDASHLLVNTRQASQTRTTQQVYEECLYRIVNVVCNGNNRVAVLLAQLGKPRVTQSACSHLHRLARALHLAHGVEALVITLDAIRSCTLLHQYFILITLLATQAEVAVRNAYVVATIYAQRHQYHRIHTSRYGQ